LAKGTNRSQFLRGLVDKYSWVDMAHPTCPVKSMPHFYGRSWNQPPPSPKRIDIWQQYHQAFASLEAQGKVRRPIIPDACQHNAHIYLSALAHQTPVMP